MENSIPSNWYVITIQNKDIYINYQDKIMKMEPPFEFKNFVIFLVFLKLKKKNYDFSVEKEDILSILTAQSCLLDENIKNENKSKHSQKKEVIVDRENVDEEEVNLIELKNIMIKEVKSNFLK